MGDDCEKLEYNINHPIRQETKGEECHYRALVN